MWYSCGFPIEVETHFCRYYLGLLANLNEYTDLEAILENNVNTQDEGSNIMQNCEHGDKQTEAEQLNTSKMFRGQIACYSGVLSNS